MDSIQTNKHRVRLVDLISSELGIIEVKRRFQKKGTRPYFVEMTEGTEEWIRKFHENNESCTPTYKPSIVPPKPWVSAFVNHNECLSIHYRIEQFNCVLREYLAQAAFLN